MAAGHANLAEGHRRASAFHAVAAWNMNASTTLIAQVGEQQVAVRINGGPWRAPRGLAAIADKLGGAAGLVIIP